MFDRNVWIQVYFHKKIGFKQIPRRELSRENPKKLEGVKSLSEYQKTKSSVRFDGSAHIAMHKRG